VHITPILILDGQDVSRYFLTSHSEQTGNSSKDPGKYDITLANVAAGSQAPSHPRASRRSRRRSWATSRLHPRNESP